MFLIRGKKIMVAVIFLMAAMALQFAPVPPTSASDHIDSPIITHDRSSDLTDTFAFLVLLCQIKVNW